jgi:hypothetical protein
MPDGCGGELHRKTSIKGGSIVASLELYNSRTAEVTQVGLSGPSVIAEDMLLCLLSSTMGVSGKLGLGMREGLGDAHAVIEVTRVARRAEPVPTSASTAEVSTRCICLARGWVARAI